MTQGTDVEGGRQPAQAGEAAATEIPELVASFVEGSEQPAQARGSIVGAAISVEPAAQAVSYIAGGLVCGTR